MRKKIVTGKLLLCLLLMVNAICFAKGQKEASKTFSDILTETRQKFDVDFVYESNTFPSIKISFDISKYTTVDNLLEDLFKPYNIRFKKVLKRAYVIYKTSADYKKLTEMMSLQQPVTDIGLQVATIAVSGIVTDQLSGQPLESVSVVVKGTTNGTTTDKTGAFKLNVPDAGAVLLVSLIGYQKQEIKVGGNTDFSVKLVSTSSALNEVVVIGYGTQKVTKISGAISTVKGSDIEKLKPVRVEEALQGTVSGVNVIQSGSPGSKPLITIRGIPSYSGNGPLVVIDGNPQTQDDLNSINPADIESISVLKDAASASIYGVSGGNGVLVVTTKAGRKNQKTEFTISSNYGIQEVMNTIPVLNAAEYGAIVNEGSVVSGGPVVFPDLSVLGVGTNWQNEIFKKAPFQTHNISARGGTDKVSYFLGGGYLSQGGIVGGYDKSRFNRLNFTSNLTFDLTPKLKFILNTTYLNLSSKGVQENSFNSIIGSALNYDPTVTINNTVPGTVGKYGFSNLLLSEIFNPLTKLENSYNKNIGNKLYGKFEFQYEVIKGLKLTSRFGYTKYDGNAKTFNPLVFYGINNVDNSMNADGSAVAGKHNSVSHEKANYNNFNLEVFGNYNFKIADAHTFETVAGFSMAKSSSNVAGASRQDVPFNSWEFADYTAAVGNNSSTNPDAVKGYYYQNFKRNLSFFGRVNYDYKERYLASVTVRRDGSTTFGKDNKFGIFPSGSLGWVISKEEFFKSAVIDFLKIRGSYGALGSDNVSPQFASIQTDYLASLYGSGNSIGYTFGNNFVSGSTLGALGNDQLRWEKQIQLNVGFDITLLKNKITLSADYYQKKTNGLLYIPSASLYIGTVPAPFANIGSTKTSGFDILLNYNENITRNLKLSSSVTFTTVKNLVTATNDDGSARQLGGYYFNGQSQSVTVFEKGMTPAYYYGYVTDGLFQTTKDIETSATQTGAQPGDIKFVDLNNDGVIDAKDQTKIGDPFPKFTIGWNLNLSYKDFDFTVFTYASSGNSVYRAYERNANYTNKFRSVLARWTGPGTTNDAHNPRYSFTDANNNSRVSDRFVEDGSFIKVKNILLGYNFQCKAVKKIFKSLRLYGQVKNAFTFTKYSGYDPEISANSIFDAGVDRGSYPQARTYAVGLDIKF
jgi:TonB-dependent starch-binding outer membrane protein SusC